MNGGPSIHQVGGVNGSTAEVSSHFHSQIIGDSLRNHRLIMGTCNSSQTYRCFTIPDTILLLPYPTT